MDQRVQQFVTDAQRPRDNKTPKDIAKLRSFLFKNQEYRFTDSEQQRLFQAIQLYVTLFSSHPEPDSPALGLVEDAFKMPFTVFTTNQKKSMLKWLDKLNGKEAAAAGDSHAAGSSGPTQWTLLDVTATSAEVMNEEGDTQQVDLAVCDGDLVAQLRQQFEAEEAELLVELGVRHGKAAITRLVWS